MNRHYYYLISALPELYLDDYKEPYRVKEFIRELYEHLSPEHFSYLEDMLHFFDNANIIDCAMGEERPWTKTTGNWTFEQLKEKFPFSEDESSEYLRLFMRELSRLRDKKAKFSRQDVELIVWRNFYKKMLRSTNNFLRRYYYFDLNLRNILCALNMRKFNLKDISFLQIDEDTLPEQLSSSQANDFGISRDFAFMPGLIEIFSRADAVYLEKFIDRLRWDMIDSINTFSYFNIDVLLAYLVKLMIVERWILLDEGKGRKVFEKLTEVKTEQIYK